MGATESHRYRREVINILDAFMLRHPRSTRLLIQEFISAPNIRDLQDRQPNVAAHVDPSGEQFYLWSMTINRLAKYANENKLGERGLCEVLEYYLLLDYNQILKHKSDSLLPQ